MPLGQTMSPKVLKSIRFDYQYFFVIIQISLDYAHMERPFELALGCTLVMVMVRNPQDFKVTKNFSLHIQPTYFIFR